MKIDSTASVLIHNLHKTSPKGMSDPLALLGTEGSGTTGGSTATGTPFDASQMNSLSSPRSLALQAEISAQLAALPRGDATGATGTAASDSGSQDVHSMTNAQLLAYGKAQGLGDVVAHFTVDYAAVDNTQAGQAAMYQQLMSDPTKHDFVREFTEAASWQAQHGASDGGASFLKMAAELAASDKTKSA